MIDNVKYSRRLFSEKIKIDFFKSIYVLAKRMFDILAAIFSLVILIPISLIIKIVYVLNGDFNNIFYMHKRVGKDGKEFYMYKFRTMIPNADEKLIELLKDEKIKKEWESRKKACK